MGVDDVEALPAVEPEQLARRPRVGSDAPGLDVEDLRDVIGEDMVARAPDGSHLVGSAITMPQTVRNLEAACRLTPEDVQKLTSENPRRALQSPGCLAPSDEKTLRDWLAAHFPTAL